MWGESRLGLLQLVLYLLYARMALGGWAVEFGACLYIHPGFCAHSRQGEMRQYTRAFRLKRAWVSLISLSNAPSPCLLSPAKRSLIAWPVIKNSVFWCSVAYKGHLYQNGGLVARELGEVTGNGAR